MNVFEPTPEMICIEDIAHALSHQCRFGGHLPCFYSVAQHSVLAYSMAVKMGAYQLQALMHDASEAYLLDIPKPIKNRLSNYVEIEDNLMTHISKKFGFEYPLSDQTKTIDRFMLEWEWDAIMLGNTSAAIPIVSWRPDMAYKNFLTAFKEANNGR